VSAFLEPREFGGSEFISWAALTLTADALEAASWRFGNRADEGAACRGDIPVRPAAISPAQRRIAGISVPAEVLHQQTAGRVHSTLYSPGSTVRSAHCSSSTTVLTNTRHSSLVYALSTLYGFASRGTTARLSTYSRHIQHGVHANSTTP